MSVKFDFESKLPFLWAASMGLIDGIIPVGKYGQSAFMDSGDNIFDIWDVSPQGTNKENQLRYLTEFSDIYVACEDSSCVQNILVIGIFLNASNQWELVPELVQLNGYTLVKLANQYIRIVRAFNNNGEALPEDAWFSTESNASNWTDGKPDNLTTVQAHIATGAQQTLMTHMTTPENYHTLMYSLTAGIVGGRNTTTVNADVELVFKPFGGVDLVKKTFQLMTQGTSYIHEPLSVLRYIPPKTDVRLRITDVSRDLTAVSASYDLLFFRKDRLPDELISIIP